MSNYKIVTSLYASTFKSVDASGAGKSKNNTILMGSYVLLTGSTDRNWQEVKAFGTTGWINSADIGDEPGLKVFFVDVGQGDGALIEVGNDFKMLIDGGPDDNLGKYLEKWQYKYYFTKNLKVHFDYVVISHFDKDHYAGLIDIINDDHYTFGTIFVNGIAKFNNKKDDFPESYNTELGQKIKVGNEEYLHTNFSDLDELEALKNNGGMLDLMQKFVFAVSNARQQGRLENFKRADFQTPPIVKTIAGKLLKLDFLGPVTESSPIRFKYFDDEAHTINGHSIVLKLSYGKRSVLFGGDLNTPAEVHLLQHYGTANPFEVDIAKSCHHGASEFTTAYMAKVNPYATVISSGDNESYSHPRADAIGCAGKYTKSDRPLVFSTELARSTDMKPDKIKYCMINLRCNGDDVIMAQMKEVVSGSSVWDLYDKFII
jgi:competence protein ComEC